MEAKELVKILEEVPEFNLRLIQITREITDDTGAIDAQKMSFRRKEVEEAASEAEAYVKTTKEAIQCLINMGHS